MTPLGGSITAIICATVSLMLFLLVHTADIDDRDGAPDLIKAIRYRLPWLRHVFADGGYAGRLVKWASDKTQITLEIICRGPHAKGFGVLPRRWVVERTFALTRAYPVKADTHYM